MRKRKSPWIYMVYNWDVPVACYTNSAAAVAAVVHVTRNWERPFPFGSIKVVRYRPVSGVTVGTIFDCVEEDVTDVILRVSDKVRKEAVNVK